MGWIPDARRGQIHKLRSCPHSDMESVCLDAAMLHVGRLRGHTLARAETQWWGDARVQAWNTFHLGGDTRLFRRGIRQIAAQTTPNGLTYGHSPTIAHNCVLPDFTLMWLLTLWDDYWQTGSLETFIEHRATVGQGTGILLQPVGSFHGAAEMRSAILVVSGLDGSQ